ncbi:MAG: hypothetical protein Q8S94_11375 [Pseudohongiella sp.]|nr:hypothetical protein [Pseudohongiella sp.]
MTLSVLVLEDDPSKKEKLLGFLECKKNLFHKIEVAICTKDAISCMHKEKYDLFLADIVVPIVLGGEKNEDNCVELFNRLDEPNDALFTPSYSVPFSSATDLDEDALEFFKNRPWGIVKYNEESDESLNTIESISRYIIRQKKREFSAKSADIFIITALDEPEFSALEEIDYEWMPYEPLDDCQMVRYGTIKFNDSREDLRIAAAFAPQMGLVASSILTIKAILQLKPKLVIMGGICAGVKGKANIGDVVGADITWNWQSGKYVNKSGVKSFQIAPHQIELDSRVKQELLLLKKNQPFWNSLATLAIEHKMALPRLVVGPVATGSSVLADGQALTSIKDTQQKNVCGLDMETYGVYFAAQSVNPRIPVVSLKAVCDYADTKKNDKYQLYASRISALAIDEFIRNHTQSFT